MGLFSQCELHTFDDRASWLNGRRLSIGSSDASAIVGLGFADQSEMTVWESKVFDEAPMNAAKTAYLNRGSIAERYIRELCQVDFGWNVLTDPPHSTRRSLTYPLLSASLDGYLDDETILEIKAIGRFNTHEWDFVNGIAPLKYIVQATHQMLVTGSRKAKIIALHGLDLIPFDVPFEPELAAALIGRYERFWSYVQQKTPPPADDKQATWQSLARRTPVRKGETIALDGEANSWADEFARLEKEIEKQEKRFLFLKNNLARAMNGAEYAQSQSGVAIRYAKHGNGRRLSVAKSKRNL